VRDQILDRPIPTRRQRVDLVRRRRDQLDDPLTGAKVQLDDVDGRSSFVEHGRMMPDLACNRRRPVPAA
jgi:hypothetical protein